ncbi:MAG: hypothetical protein JOZ18_03505 [Chloroflexi bacterium]|nr:hypothetical protein [Chloroflexota bacterium]
MYFVASLLDYLQMDGRKMHVLHSLRANIARRFAAYAERPHPTMEGYHNGRCSNHQTDDIT